MLISVIIPLYNKRTEVLRALQSVFSQTVPPLEILVINDGSTDGSDFIVAELKNPLIRLIHQRNGGVSVARNKGIQEAKGEWIAFLDADDEWLPEFIETIKKLHQLYADCNVLGTAYYNCFSNKNEKLITLKNIHPETFQILDYFKVAAYSSPSICSSAVTIRKESLKRILGFPAGITAGEDLLTWVKLAKSNKIGYCTKGMARYHIETNLTARKSRWESIVANNEEVTSRLNKLLNLSDTYERYYLAEWYKMISMQYIRLSLKKQAFSTILKSIRLRPIKFKTYLYLLLLLYPQKNH